MTDGSSDGAATDARRTLYAAPALEKAFDIIEELVRAPFGLTLSETAQRLGRSIGEIFRIMIVMERRGWLARNHDTDRYTVTEKMLLLAYQATPARALAGAAPSEMERLARESNQSCHLVVPAEGRGLVAFREAAPGPTSFALRLGAEVDLLTSCSGHVILAFSDEAARAAMLKAAAPAPDEAGLRATLDRIRKRGHAMMPSARTRGVTDVSVPVFGADGKLVAALTSPVLDYIEGGQSADPAAMRQMLGAAARRISLALSCAGEQPSSPAAAARPGCSEAVRRRRAKE